MTQLSYENAAPLVFLLISQLWLMRSSQSGNRWDLINSLIWFVAYVYFTISSP